MVEEMKSPALIAVCALLVSAACSQGGATEDEKAAEAVVIVYKLVSEGDYQTLWESDIRILEERCSFDGYVASWEEFKRMKGGDELVAIEVTAVPLGDVALANFVVEVRADGEIVDDYPGRMTLRKEDGQWRHQWAC